MNQRNRGYLLALVGVFIFALTMPVTRLSVNSQIPGTVSPEFATFMRALIAGVCSFAYLAWNRKLQFPRAMLAPMLVSAAGTVLGFPLLLSLGLASTTSTQGAIVIGFLPLATAVMMCLYLGKRQNLAFWACAVTGFGLIVLFSLMQGGGAIGLADFYLILAVFAASIGYVAGIKVSQVLSPSVAICWVLIISLSFSLPMTVYFWPTHPVSPTVWVGVGYMGLFSMWLGFFAWYKGMMLAGAIAASQVQLLQPFMALFLSFLVLGEPLTLITVLFAGALIATLLISKKVSLAN